MPSSSPAVTAGDKLGTSGYFEQMGWEVAGKVYVEDRQ